MLASAGRRWFARALLLFAYASSVHAQGRYDVEAFEPALQVEGSVLNVYGGRSLAPGRFSLAIFGSYGHEPLQIETANGDKVGNFVGGIGSAQLLAAVGLFERVDLGVGFALHYTGEGSDFRDRRLAVASNPESKVAVGDVRLAPRVSLLRHDGPSGVDLALVVPIWLPTGNDSSYAGEPFRIEPRVAFDYHSDRVLFVVNAGYRVRSAARVINTELNDQVTLGLGADVRVAGGLGLLATADSRLNVLADDLGVDDIDTELLLGARYAANGFRVQLGGGPGVTQAFSAPAVRVFAALSYTHEPAPPTLAPPPPEPDPVPDADRDGVPDASDRCPNEAEDGSGIHAADGCPDPDADRDGLSDAHDRCPSEPEDREGYQDDDGCPDHDNDGDGVNDAADGCPNEAGAQEERGCPAKPAPEPEAPPPPAAPALNQVIRFETNSLTILADQQHALDELAQQLKDHLEIERISIAGHSDDRGSAELNLRLSRGRADAVRGELIRRGVDGKRLHAQGLGSARPIASNDSAEGRALNRRVELQIESAHAQ
jgi:outer membrane protein OmpA-like peptidoglycan-associated protein